MNQRNRINIYLFLVIFFASIFSGCLKSDPRFDARKKLTDIGVYYSTQSYLERIIEGDDLAVGLFLQAGMSADEELNITPILLSSDSEFSDWKRSFAKSEKAWSSLVGDQIRGYKYVYLTAYSVAKIKSKNQAQGSLRVGELLYNSGANLNLAQAKEERVRNDLSLEEKSVNLGGAGDDSRFMESIRQGVDKLIAK